MNTLPQGEVNVIDQRTLPPLQPNSVIVIVNTLSEVISLNPITGHQNRRSTWVSPFVLDTINLCCSSHDHIISLLHRRLGIFHWLFDHLASEISTAAINLGLGRNDFTMTVEVKVTYRTILVNSNDEKLLRMVLLGRVKAEDLKSLNMETESCSICLENLSGGPIHSSLTRMTCSHVFHIPCLLEWLGRKNTCPLCRTVLYDQ